MLEAIFWDVQHGSAALIITPNGKHIAIDLGIGSYGNSNVTFSPLLHAKEKYNIKNLDCVIITHPHRDHLDDIYNFYELNPTTLNRPKHLSSQEIFDSNKPEDQEILEKYLEISERYRYLCPPHLDPFKEANNGGVQIQTFTPKECAISNLNNHSVVTVVSYAGLKMLIPGDNQEPSWNELLEKEDFISAIKGIDILVASHHGRENGFSSALFDKIGKQPYLTIISDGPEGETSAVGRYREKTKGFTVHKRSGGTEERKCLTTRKDGVIAIRFGTNLGDKPFIEVTID